MRVVNFNQREKIAKIQINSLDDLWHLSKVIEENDLVSGKSERKVKLGGETERQKSSRKSVYLKIKVSKVIFDQSNLRVQGTVAQGTEEIPINSAHTIELAPGMDFKLQKARWYSYQLARLKEAESASVAPKALVCVLDDEQANFAFLTSSGMRSSGSLSLRLSKKRMKEGKQNDIERVAKHIISKAEKANKVILASPLFWKELVMKEVKSRDPKLAKNILLADVSTGTKRALHEIFSGGVVDKVLKDSQAAKEEKLVTELLEGLAKNTGLVAYGLNEVKKAVDSAAIKILLVNESLMTKENADFIKLRNLIDKVEAQKAEIHIIEARSEAGKKLKSLSGVAALLRFKV